MRVSDYTLYSATNLAASATTDAVDMGQMIGLSVQTVWTSTTASFTLTLQVSNDGTTWVDTSQTATVNNNNSAVMLTAIDFMHKYARVNVARTSGTITSLSLRVIAKGI